MTKLGEGDQTRRGGPNSAGGPNRERPNTKMLFSFFPSMSSPSKHKSISCVVRDLSKVLIPVNVNHSCSSLDYTSRAPMTREEFLFFVDQIKDILHNSRIHTTEFLEDVRDNFRGDALSFILFSEEMRCKFGWNHNGVYVSPIKYYPMFGSLQWSNRDYITVGDGLRYLTDVFQPVPVSKLDTLKIQPPSPTPICKSLIDALIF